MHSHKFFHVECHAGVFYDNTIDSCCAVLCFIIVLVAQGPIPECFTNSKSLKHLYLSDNALTGPLPDFSADSSLQLFFVRNQVANGQPTLTGSIPASLGSAAALQYLQLANNGLTGSMGELPANLK